MLSTRACAVLCRLADVHATQLGKAEEQLCLLKRSACGHAPCLSGHPNLSRNQSVRSGLNLLLCPGQDPAQARRSDLETLRACYRRCPACSTTHGAPNLGFPRGCLLTFGRRHILCDQGWLI